MSLGSHWSLLVLLEGVKEVSPSQAAKYLLVGKGCDSPRLPPTPASTVSQRVKGKSWAHRDRGGFPERVTYYSWVPLASSTHLPLGLCVASLRRISGLHGQRHFSGEDTCGCVLSAGGKESASSRHTFSGAPCWSPLTMLTGLHDVFRGTRIWFKGRHEPTWMPGRKVRNYWSRWPSFVQWGYVKSPMTMLSFQSYDPKPAYLLLTAFHSCFWLSSASIPGLTVRLSRGKMGVRNLICTEVSLWFYFNYLFSL